MVDAAAISRLIAARPPSARAVVAAWLDKDHQDACALLRDAPMNADDFACARDTTGRHRFIAGEDAMAAPSRGRCRCAQPCIHERRLGPPRAS